MRLAGRAILVTGSATGVGEGIVRRAAAEGARVVVHGREEEREAGEALARDLGGAFVAGDLADPLVPARVIEEAVGLFGRLDGLVNNAGVSWRGGLEAPHELFDEVMAVNARAPFLLVGAARPHLEASRGAVVNIGSVNAHRTAPNLLVYGMSKAALTNLARTLAGTLAEKGVRINGLNIGWTLTPNERRLLVDVEGWAEDWPETMGARMPFGRLFAPDEVAALVAYLLSDEAALVSGQVWDVDQRSVVR